MSDRYWIEAGALFRREVRRQLCCIAEAAEAEGSPFCFTEEKGLLDSLFLVRIEGSGEARRRFNALRRALAQVQGEDAPADA